MVAAVAWWSLSVLYEQETASQDVFAFVLFFLNSTSNLKNLVYHILFWYVMMSALLLAPQSPHPSQRYAESLCSHSLGALTCACCYSCGRCLVVIIHVARHCHCSAALPSLWRDFGKPAGCLWSRHCAYFTRTSYQGCYFQTEYSVLFTVPCLAPHCKKLIGSIPVTRFSRPWVCMFSLFLGFLWVILLPAKGPKNMHVWQIGSFEWGGLRCPAAHCHLAQGVIHLHLRWGTPLPRQQGKCSWKTNWLRHVM